MKMLIHKAPSELKKIKVSTRKWLSRVLAKVYAEFKL